MRVRFIKLSALANDFLLWVNPPDYYGEIVGDVARKILDRRDGIGGDGLLIVEGEDEMFMRYWNPDGTEAETCGNAIRCVGFLKLRGKGMDPNKKIIVRTKGGYHEVYLKRGGSYGGLVVLVFDFENPSYEELDLNLKDYRIFYSRFVGNPHTVLFGEIPDDVEFERLGKYVENHPHFKDRTNVEFVKITDRNYALIRIWERGVGETFHSTTGSLTGFLIANDFGWMDEEGKFEAKGGILEVKRIGNTFETIAPVRIVGEGDYFYEA